MRLIQRYGQAQSLQELLILEEVGQLLLPAKHARNTVYRIPGLQSTSFFDIATDILQTDISFQRNAVAIMRASLRAACIQHTFLRYY